MSDKNDLLKKICLTYAIIMLAQFSFGASSSEVHTTQLSFLKEFPMNKLFWIPIFVLGIWGIIGVVLGASGKIYLYSGIPDIVLSTIVSIFFAVVLVFLLQDHPDPKIFWVFWGSLPLIFLMMLPSSLQANPEKLWTLPLVIPGKLLVVYVLLACASAAISGISKVFTQKKNRLDNGITAAAEAGMAYGLYKIIQKTTRR